MPAPITLPKVASYVRNVGKSIGLASIDYLKEAAPTTAEFLETNEDIFKEIVSSVSDYRSAIKKANTAFKKSKVYEALDVGKKALFEDLRTGNWYNKEREEAIGMRAMDLDMDDEGFDDSMFSFDDTDSSDAARQSRAFDSSISASTKVQATTTAKTGELVSGTIKASTSVLFAQNERLMASMTSGMGTLHAAVSGVQDYLQGPMLTALQNTKIFQEKSMEHYAKVEAQLDEFLQMQRNLYEAASTEAKNSLGMDDVIDFDGIPDLNTYGQVIKKNFKNLLGPEAEMLLGNAFGKNSNMLLTLVSSPLKAIPELLVKTIVPLTVKRTMEQFDKSISGVFTTLISRLNFMASEDFGGNGIFSTIGKILGINVQAKNAPEQGKFKKGPIPFDGITKQTIVEVIPAHLRRIEAALTGASERLYDMSNGRWTTVNEAKERYDERKKSVSRSSFSDVAEPINKYIEELRKENTEATQEMADRFVDALKTITDKVYEDKGRFLGYKRHNDPDFGDQSAWDYYNVDKDVYMAMMKLANKSDIMNLANSTFREISSWNSFIKNIEQDPTNIYNQLFNNAYQFDRTKTPNGVPYSNFLTAAVDENKKNIFYYLRGIYGILLANNRNGNRRRSTTEDSGREAITPEEALREALNSDTIVNSTTDTSTGPVYNTEGRSPEEVLTSMLFALKQDEDGNPIESEERVFKKFTKGSSFSEKWKIAQENINLVLTKPTEALTKIINRADTRVFELLFGKEETAEMERKYGNKPGGVIEYMVIRLEESFNKLDEWLQDNVFNKIRDWLRDTGITDKFNKAREWVKEKIHWDDIREAAKNKFSWAKGQVTGAFRAVGRDVYNSSPVQQTMYTGTLAANQRRRTRSFTGNNFSDILGSNRGAIGGNNGNISDDVWEEFKNKIAEYRASGMTYNQAEEAARRDLGFAASGKFITKRGLAVVSPGEIIIPATFSKAGQSRQLSKEKSYAKRFGFKNVGYYATGTDSIDGQAKGIPVDQVEEEKRKVADTIKQVAKEVNMSGDYADLAVNSLIGGGVSLITGMVGGPLLGAALGAGISIIKQSETAKRFLFGKEGEDGEREGGLFSAKFQKNFKKYFPDMKNYGIVGSIAGLFTPFGLVGGLMAGGAIGFLKNNESFQNFLFGPADENGERDGGLISKAFREKVTKAAPSMAVGAVGGLLFGPFGILGNAVLGSAVGYVTTTQKFHDIIFGYDDENGKHKDGLIDALKKGFINPIIKWGGELKEDFIKYFNNKILKPLGNFVKPFNQMIKNGITGFFDFLKDTSAKFLESSIGRPIADFFQHTIFENVAKWTKRFLKLPIGLAKGIVAAPFQLLGGIGNNIRTSQIAKGTAGDMTAQERLDWREKHRFRMFGKEITGHDKFKNLDRKLADMKGKEGIERMKILRDQLKLYEDTRGELGKQIAELVRKAGEIISEFFNGTPIPDDPSVMSYTAIGSRRIKEIHKAVRDGDLNKIGNLLSKFVKVNLLSEEDANTLLNQLSPYVEQIAELIEKKKNSADYRRDLQNQLGAQTGGTLRTTKNIRRFSRLLDKEIAAREKEEIEAKKDPQTEAVEGMSELVDKQTQKMIDLLDEINENLKINNMSAKQRKEYLRKKGLTQAETEEQSTTSSFGVRDVGNVTALDDLINGTSKDTVSKLNKGYHTIETPDGAQGLADANGNLLPTKSKSKIQKYLDEVEQENEDTRTFRERLNDSFFGKAVSKAGDLIGGAKDGLFGLFSKFFNQFSTVGNIIKWVFLGGTAVALAGHGSGWLKDSVFPWLKEHVAPWLIGTKNQEGYLQGGIRGAIFGNRNTYGEYEGGILGGVTNWFMETPVAKFFSEMYKVYKEEGFVGFFRPVIDWYFSGTEKFMDNIVTPLVGAFIAKLPDLVIAIGKGVLEGIKSWFGFKNNAKIEKDSEGNRIATNTTTGQQASIVENEDGTLSYVYSDGSIETDPNAKFAVNRTGEYANSNGTLLGQGAKGILNNFLTGVTNLGGSAATTIRKFSSKGIGKNLRKIVTGGPISKLFNGAIGGTKLAWNAAAEGGSASRTLGSNLRNAITASKTNGKDVLSNLIDIYKNGGNVVAETADNVINFEDIARAAGGTTDDVAGAATKSGGIFGKIKDFAKSITSKFTSGADDVAGAAASAAGAADDVAGAATKSGTIIDKLKNAISSIGSKAATEAAEATSNTTFITKIKDGIIDFFSKIGENSAVKKLFSGVAKVFGTSIDDVLIANGMKSVGEALAKEAGENIATSALKSVANALAAIPIATIVLAITYFVSGYNSAHDIFGLAKDFDIPICYNLIAGLVNAVKNCLPGIGIILGFIPTSTIINLFVDTLFPLFGWDNTSLKNMRQESQRLLDEYNATVSEDEQVSSIAEYNEATDPTLLQKIKNTAKNAWSSITGFFSGNSRDDEDISNEGLLDKAKSIRTNNNVNNATKSASSRSGRGHVYQHGLELANKKFGNSTIGESGCGPVAATNLINKMGGNMDVQTAANYAENGNFIDKSTGGTTTEYMSSILNNSGIPTRETNNKRSIMNSLRNGNPVVMLGNSGKEAGTPFGANDHYITAMGLDKSGNIIAEDPDLPDSYRKYKASTVMNDMSVGIQTGLSRSIVSMRRRSGGIRRGLSGLTRKHNIFSKLKGKRRRKSGGNGTTETYSIPNWAFRCANCLAEAESNGNYTAVNANDGGAPSVGRYQFNRGRATKLLHRIVNALLANGKYTDASIKSLLGDSLYNYILSESTSNFTLTNAQVNAIKTILSTDEGMIQQDLQMTNDCVNYYNSYLKKLGLVLPAQESVVIYLASSVHRTGNNKVASSVIKAASANNSVGITSLTLDQIHAEMMRTDEGKKYKSRYDKHYAYLKGTKDVGNGTDQYEDMDISQTMIDVAQLNTSSISDTYSSTSSSNNTDASGGLLSQLSAVFTDVLRYIYGDALVNALGGTSTTSNASTSSGLFGSNSSTSSGYNVVRSNVGKANNGQQALVNWMKSVEGTLKYTTDWDKQNPDNGTGSCASTVGWAYKKALGINGMSANASGQMNQVPGLNFSYVFDKDKMGSWDPSNNNPLQEGDILYYRTNGGVKLGRPRGVGHVEMYSGNNTRMGHGNPDKLGPNTKNMSSSYDGSNLIVAARYNPFVYGEQPPFTNPDGSAGVYTDDNTTTAAKLNATTNKISGYTVAAQSRRSNLVGRARNSSLGNLNEKSKRIAAKSLLYQKDYLYSVNSFPEDGTPESRAEIAEYMALKKQASGASRYGTAQSAVSYEDFLNVIIELLTIIAKNSDNLTAILNILSKTYNTNINPTDITSAAEKDNKSAQARFMEG